jgi:hypothetical protein
MMERWNSGMMGRKWMTIINIPIFQYSNIPVFQYSSIPVFQYSNNLYHV